jgi:hypothetical protein
VAHVSVVPATQVSEGLSTSVEMTPPFSESIVRWAEKNLVAGGTQGEAQAVVESASLDVFPVAEPQGFFASTFATAKVQYTAHCVLVLQQKKAGKSPITYRVQVSVKKTAERDPSPKARETVLRTLVQEVLLRLRQEVSKGAADLMVKL